MQALAEGKRRATLEQRDSVRNARKMHIDEFADPYRLMGPHGSRVETPNRDTRGGPAGNCAGSRADHHVGTLDQCFHDQSDSNSDDSGLGHRWAFPIASG